MNLQELLDALADENGADRLTELLRGASAEELSTVEAEALEAFDAIRASDSISDDDIASLDALATAVETVHSEGTRREEAAAEVAERIAAISERIHPAGEATEDETTTEDEAPAEERELEDVTASTTPRRTARVDVAAIAARRRRPAAPESTEDEGPTFSSVFRASADVPGFAAGHGFANFDEFCQAYERRAGARPSTKTAVAQIRKFGFNADNTIPEGTGDASRIFARAADPANLTASGWCSPSETWYDLCPSPVSRNNLFSLPEVNAPRGGVRYSKGFALESIVATGFRYTEAELQAGVTKPCIMVPCPTFESEVRLGVEGICIQTDIPMDSSYPEAVASYLDLVMTYYAREVSGQRLSKVVAGSIDKGTVGAAGEGATAAFFNSIDLMAVNYRNMHSADWDRLVEINLPTWVKNVIRADFIKRNGIDSGENAINLADSVINTGLALRNVQVRWIGTSHPYDTNASGFQTPAQTATTGPTQWPQTVLATMYFPGTWLALTKDVIDISTIYDSVGLSQNKFTQTFMENGVAVINRCNKSIKFTIPLCPDGTTAQMADILCTVP